MESGYSGLALARQGSGGSPRPVHGMGFSSRPQGITTPIILIQLGRLADSDMESTRLINGAFQNLPFTKAPGSFFGKRLGRQRLQRRRDVGRDGGDGEVLSGVPCTCSLLISVASLSTLWRTVARASEVALS